MFSLLRVFFAVAYLGGTFIHLYNGARQPQGCCRGADGGESDDAGLVG